MQADIKVLDRVIGEKKEFYLNALQLLARGFTEKETGLILNVTEGRISQIYKANKQLCDELTLQADLSTTAGRLRIAYRNVLKKDGCSAKDQLDWLEYIRKELAKETGLIINNTIINKVGSNGKFDGEDGELTNRFMGILREKLQK
jgi:hypothetical protein